MKSVTVPVMMMSTGSSLFRVLLFNRFVRIDLGARRPVSVTVTGGGCDHKGIGFGWSFRLFKSMTSAGVGLLYFCKKLQLFIRNRTNNSGDPVSVTDLVCKDIMAHSNIT